MRKYDPHTLTLRSRSTPNSYSPNHDGTCSCGKWVMRNYARDVIRREHYEHVAKELAPKEPEE